MRTTDPNVLFEQLERTCDQENTINVGERITAPVLDKSGCIRSAIYVSGPQSRID